MNRRDFLKLSGAGVAGASLLGAAGCESSDPLPRPPLPEPFDIRSGAQSGMNVVVVIIDSLRKDHVGAYGNPWIQTPNLDALAKESLRFERAYPESFPTICARRAIHTGMRSWPFRNYYKPKGEDISLLGWQPIPEDQTTLSTILQQNGYATLTVTDNFQMFKPSYNFQQGFDAFELIRGQTTDPYKPISMTQPDLVADSLLKGNPAALRANMSQFWANVRGREKEEEHFSPMVFSRASQLLEWASEGDNPFFMVVDCYDPHEPWFVPEKYVSLYDEGYEGKEPYSLVYGPTSYTTERERRRMEARYSAEITMDDRWLGQFLEKMDELELTDNTLVILLSDHGIAFGEHGIVGKPSLALWPEVTDITYFIRHPEGKLAGQSSDYFASTHDVAPTILSMLDVEPPYPMDGEDLSVLFDGDQPTERRHINAGYDQYVWSRDDRYVFFSYKDGGNARLYDTQKDPEMHNDISSDNQDILNKMYGEYILADVGGSLGY